MADPAQIDIVAYRRVPLTPHFAFLELDWTGSDFKMQVRATKDTTGTPLIDDAWGAGGNVSLLYAGTATVSAHIAAGRLPGAPDGYALTDSLLLSQIGLGIAEVAIAGLPTAAETGDDYTAFYDIIRHPVSGDDELIMAGKFIVRAGVTIP